MKVAAAAPALEAEEEPEEEEEELEEEAEVPYILLGCRVAAVTLFMICTMQAYNHRMDFRMFIGCLLTFVIGGEST